jgi:hypothetical protein
VFVYGYAVNECCDNLFMTCMYSWNYLRIMNMNEIARLLECFNMIIIGEYSWDLCDLLRWICIGELHVLW